ncbi:hypothetical protein C161_02600 [Paenibacillus sp. FSL R5-192]|uniref:hypothetical protein n=1 Tax=Paenibacillus sp. FSL R5-192 TaxID=1226754 RepID=UPI0003E2BF17|nr:hypothetical protein [Paenibacillus sp. FSL R5-192]ETT40819.1 hypothetical protein C161_02600 [Paenibacillus sp. FSL R5-192]
MPSSGITTGELIRKLLDAECQHIGSKGSHRYFEHAVLPGEKIPVPHAAQLSAKGKDASYIVEKNVKKFLKKIEKAKKLV